MKEQISHYITDDSWEQLNNILANRYVRDMCRWLYPKPEIIEVNKNSVGNLVFKISIILKFPEIKDTITDKESEEIEEIVISKAKTIAFQIKSSEQSAKEHIIRRK
jgi:uncharacterized protein YdhG (YjbR/CyaY superfamily)